MNIPNQPDRRIPPPPADFSIDWQGVHAMAAKACIEGADRYEKLVCDAQDAAGDPVAAEEAWRAAAVAAQELLGAQAWAEQTRERAGW